MQIPLTPANIVDLNLMQRLADYGAQKATFETAGTPLDRTVADACRRLHSMLSMFDRTVAPLLDRVTAKEMDTFTLHDHKHALKVAHLMWHIIAPERRELLTPPEIGMLVSSAYLHDLGMFLSDAEREKRLSPDSDLWQSLDISIDVKMRIEALEQDASKETEPIKKQRLLRDVYQAQEALLCIDNRERHATPGRYHGILNELRELHKKDPTNIVDIDAAMAFGGDTYIDKLVDICVSHNEGADALVRRDAHNPERPRFPRDYPVGASTADLQLVAAALRVADILDFDRERTPPVLFHYFIPGALCAEENRSTLEWSKHLTISNWHIDPDAIVFRGRCRSHIVHHGVVTFCSAISTELSATLSICNMGVAGGAVIAVPSEARADIHAEGYTYVPYRFEIDTERIYQLLMGRSLYSNPLACVRELLQNAVDACQLRDSLTKLTDPGMTPSKHERIVITYQDAGEGLAYPTLEVRDTGTGMDDWAITHWLLKVGHSFYASAEFNKMRSQLRQNGLDFAPTSEFGIGFLSTFLLADKVEVETAMWEPVRGDTRRRVLEIHGPTRLMRLSEDQNNGVARFRGTRVRMTLTGGLQRGGPPPNWRDVQAYIEETCFSLPYSLLLRHVAGDSVEEKCIEPQSVAAIVPERFEAYAVRIPVDDSAVGLKGEIAFLHPTQGQAVEASLAEETLLLGEEDASDGMRRTSLLRGGFRVGEVPGLPQTFRIKNGVRATVSVTWSERANRRYPITNLSRTALNERGEYGCAIAKAWLSWLLEHVDKLPEGMLESFDFSDEFLREAAWLERFSGYDLYRLAANGWKWALRGQGITEVAIEQWEKCLGGPLSRCTPWRGLLHQVLQDLVLPRVCRLQVGKDGRRRLFPPSIGWEEVLKGCYNFMRDKCSWGCFAEYETSIGDVFMYVYLYENYVNIKYKDIVTDVFDELEIPELIDSLKILIDSRMERRVALSSKQLSYLRRAQNAFGGLEIESVYGKWTIERLKVGGR